MFSLLKKDIKMLIRDKKELAILLLMPFLLIAILGFALGGFLETSTPPLDMTIILVSEDEADQGTERLKHELSEMSLPSEALAQLTEATDELKPQAMLRSLLESEQLAGMVSLLEMDRQAALTALEQDEANAVLIMPTDFTYDTLNKMLLGRGEGAAFDLRLSDVSSLRAGVIADILESFVYTVNFQSALGQSIGERAGNMDAFTPPVVNGEIVNVPQAEPVSSLQYYTFGMIVMFVLFVAVSISSGAFIEKNGHTYNRILLSGTNPLKFLMGKILSSALLAFLQIAILVGLSSLVFQSFSGQPARFWLELSVVSIVLSLFIGTLGGLLTAISYRFGSKSFTDVFSSIIVTLFAFFGGSFLPVSQLSEWFALIGEWTPNGAALTSYLQVIQGAEVERWMLGIYRIIGLLMICLLLSFIVFPKRRVS